MPSMRISLLIVLVAWLDGFRSNYVHQVHMAPSRQDLIEGDSFQLTCWADTSDAFAALCDGVENVVIKWQREIIAGARRNETAVYVDIASAPAKHSTGKRYDCECNNQILTSDRFDVSVKLRAPDFSCQFNDNETSPALRCSFAKPPAIDISAVNPRFTLQFKGRRFACGELETHKTRVLCMVPSPWFSRFHNGLSLTLELSGQQLHFQLPRAQYIILPRPLNTAVILRNRTADGICVSWKDYQFSNHGSVQVEWSLQLAPNVSYDWQCHGPPGVSNRVLCVERLPYAWHNYSLGLRQRYPDPKARWSEAGELSFSTAATRPPRPPAVWPSGYHIDTYNRRVLHVYWQGLGTLEHNGPDFGYDVSVRRADDDNNNNDDSLVRHVQTEIQPNMAIISGLSTTTNSYRIIVRSRNAVGVSLESSEVRIPRLKEPAQRMPHSLHVPHGTQQLRWSSPPDRDQLLGYTVYWCSANVTHGSRCRDPLVIQAQPLNSTETNYTTLDVHSFLWAVSADYGDGAGAGSGGLCWMQLHFAGDDVNADWMRHIQGVVALLVLGLFIYASVRKLGKPPLPPVVAAAAAAEEIPLVLHGNFKPLNLPAATPTTPETASCMDCQLPRAASPPTTALSTNSSEQ